MDAPILGARMRRCQRRREQRRCGNLLGQSLVRAMLVVVLSIDPKDALKMACIDVTGSEG
jgi:hypothetical protein